jgi:antitoxin component of MazEF toxin-antitoxin module
MDDQFYLQDSRSYVGDGLSFWAFGGGYTTNLENAEIFSLSGATDQHECRETDIPWPKAYVDARARVGVDCQYVKLAESLDQYSSATEFYIQKPQCWNGNNLIWMTPDGSFSSDLLKAAVVRDTETIRMIGRFGNSGAVIWPKAYIDAHARRLVERDDVNLKKALSGTGVVLIKPKRPRMMMFNCDGCGRFISDAQRYREDCRNCGTSNTP